MPIYWLEIFYDSDNILTWYIIWQYQYIDFIGYITVPLLAPLAVHDSVLSQVLLAAALWPDGGYISRCPGPHTWQYSVAYLHEAAPVPLFPYSILLYPDYKFTSMCAHTSAFVGCGRIKMKNTFCVILLTPVPPLTRTIGLHKSQHHHPSYCRTAVELVPGSLNSFVRREGGRRRRLTGMSHCGVPGD